MTIVVRFHFGRLDQMPRCAACGLAICHHTDLEFAGFVPVHPSAAAPLSGGSGGAGAFLPRANASAPIPAPVHQSSDDAFNQHTNANRTFHGGGIR